MYSCSRILNKMLYLVKIMNYARLYRLAIFCQYYKETCSLSHGNAYDLLFCCLKLDFHDMYLTNIINRLCTGIKVTIRI